MKKVTKNSNIGWSQVFAIGEKYAETWDEYEEGCLATFHGGYLDEGGLKAFQRGMKTVFNLLKKEFTIVPGKITPIDMARFLSKILDKNLMSVPELAEHIGQTEEWINEKLRLLNDSSNSKT